MIEIKKNLYYMKEYFRSSDWAVWGVSDKNG